MDLIEVILLNYRFKFRRLFWQEEFGLQAKSKNRDARRVLLAAALQEVSGLKIKSFDNAWRLMEAIPTPIMYRVFLIYKGKQPETRMFATRNLYKAPAPTVYGQRLEESAEATERAADVVVQRMEQQFGKKELAEAAEVDRQIVTASRLRGAIRKNDDEDANPLGGFKVRPNA